MQKRRGRPRVVKSVGDVVKTKNLKDSLEISTLSTRIKTLEDALKKGKVDTTIWDTERYIINSWEVGAKGPDGRIVIEPLWQVKVWLKKKAGPSLEDFRAALLKDLKIRAPKNDFKKYVGAKEKLLYELAIFDHHIGKLCWEEESGSNYDIKIAEEVYYQAVDELLSRITCPIDRILYPIGNDYYHADNHRGTTHAGTVLDVDGRWQKAFTKGREVVVNTIEKLRQIAPVDVMIIPGNHDYERIFYLGDVLDTYYSRTRYVKINNEPKPRKYYNYYNNTIGFTHGNEESHSDLPRLMADEAPKYWAKSKFREWHIGHFHKRAKKTFITTEDTVGSTIIRTMPSLAGQDAWHNRSGYTMVPRMTDAILWHSDGGPITVHTAPAMR